MGRKDATADVVICVHDALAHVRTCLDALTQHTDPRYGVILVDDGSRPACWEVLVRFAQEHSHCTLIRNDQRRGYTNAANQGLHHSCADLVVLLNSDTRVTASWLTRIQDCVASDSRIGIAGPMSNAAGYQSVPEVFSANGDWSRNPFPPAWGLDEVGELVAAIAPRVCPRVGFVHGFCFAITRQVIEAIGYLDAIGFPEAYGEEDDYCLRATARGFTLAIAEHAYVYHAQAQSYADPAHRARLKQAGTDTLLRKHGGPRLRTSLAQLVDEPTLAAMRWEVGRYLGQASPPTRLADAASPL